MLTLVLLTATGHWCGRQCGFSCHGWRVVNGACQLSNTTVNASWNARAVTHTGCYPHTHECISCPSTPHPATLHPHYTLYASGHCRSHLPGTLSWNSTLEIKGGALIGQPGTTIRGACPLVAAYDDADVSDVQFECTSGDHAIEILGTGVQVVNVRSNTAVVRGVNVKGLNVKGLSVLNCTSDTGLVGVLGHVYGGWSFDCGAIGDGLVVAQPLSGVGSYGSCRHRDISVLLNVFGRHYEVIGYMILAIVITVPVLLIIHQDVWFYHFYTVSQDN